MDLAVEVPKDELGPVASNEMWQEIYDRIAALIQEHRTTLVFVNTRRLAERVAHHLAERLGEDAVLAHHGSLSRKLRLNAEEKLKDGKLKAVVATASLELGIDIGTVDLVCQIGSPRSIAVALQRIGRSGHQVEHTTKPKGRIFATTRDELIECAALVRSISQGELDRLLVPATPLDVLAQQIVAMAAAEDWQEDDLFALVRRAYCYARSDAHAISTPSSTCCPRASAPSAAAAARSSIAIGCTASSAAGAARGSRRLLPAARFQTTRSFSSSRSRTKRSSARSTRISPSRAWPATCSCSARRRGASAASKPAACAWRMRTARRRRFRSGAAKRRAARWSCRRAVSDLRARILELSEMGRSQPDPDFGHRFPDRRVRPRPRGAEQAVLYVRAGAAALGALPSVNTVVAERFFDEGGGMQLVLHAPFGARINRAWGLALRKRFCRSFNFELQAAATDNGIVISLSDQHSFPLELVFKFLSKETVEEVLTQAMLPAPMFEVRWRWNTSRALAVLRFSGGRKVPPQIQRMRADDLLAAVFPDQAACQENIVGDIRIPDHPLVNETIKDCLHEAMDLDGLKQLVEDIGTGAMKTVAIDTPEPSPFSHEILNANPYAYLDDAPLEERRARAVQMRRTLGPDAGGVGALDPAAIAEVAAESWPVARDADELHDALLTLIVVPPVREWEEFFRTLRESRRATVLSAGGANFWVAAERLKSARLLYPDSMIAPDIDDYDRTPTSDQESAATETLRGWLESTGPQTQSSLSQRFALPDRGDGSGAPSARSGRTDSARPLHRVGGGPRQRDRMVQPPGARPHPPADARPAAPRDRAGERPRLHAVPVSLAAREAGHAASWTRRRASHHQAAAGIRNLRRGLGRRCAPAASRQVRARAARSAVPFRRGRLGTVVAASGVRRSGAGQERRPPGASVPRGRRRSRCFCERTPRGCSKRPRHATASADGQTPDRHQGLSGAARQVLESLSRRGASFLADVVRDTRQLTSVVEDALWELAAAGLVTADGFENLRALIDPKRRLATAKHPSRRPRFVPGRWALLSAFAPPRLDDQRSE